MPLPSLIERLAAHRTLSAVPRDQLGWVVSVGVERTIEPEERCLILGVGVLDDLRLRPFKAVLAHESGHFSNRDTAGGGFALAVRRSLFSLAINLARGGAASWYNPVWLFVQGFNHLFLRISQGASRLQEVLADRWAATLYGAQAFEDGLRHVIERSVRFGAHVDAVFQDAIVSKREIRNLYQYEPARPAHAADIQSRVREILEAQPSPYDSHPRPIDRFQWVHALDTPWYRHLTMPSPCGDSSTTAQPSTNG